MSNYIKNIFTADFLGAELSLLVLNFITDVFTRTETVFLSVIIALIYILRYLFRLRQRTAIKMFEIMGFIILISLSYFVNVNLILIVGLFAFLVLLENNVKSPVIKASLQTLFSLVGYTFLFFLARRGTIIFLYVVSLHLMLIITREFFYFASLENEEGEEYLDRVNKYFFIGRFIIYMFFVNSPLASFLKMVRLITYVIPLLLLIDIPYIIFFSYIRISHSNRNFRRITLFASYTIPLFYLILLTGRF